MSDGEVTDSSAGPLVHGVLHHFAIGGAALSQAQRNWLNHKVAPLLRRGGSVSLVGQASRSGGEGFNKRLSEKRADAVRLHLEKQANQCFQYAYFGGVGESAAAQAGQADGTEDGQYRAVVVLAHAKTEPPKPKLPPPKPKKQVSDVWLGVGEAHSGDLVILGYHNWNAIVYRLSSDADGNVDWASLTSHGLKLGGGLGGSGGAVAIFAHGIKKAGDFKAGFNWGNVDFDLAIGGQLSSALKGLKGVGKVIKTMGDYKKLTYVGQELAKNRAFVKKGVYTIPIPLAGGGVHVWVGRKYSETMLNSTGKSKVGP